VNTGYALAYGGTSEEATEHGGKSRPDAKHVVILTRKTHCLR